ncbi:MAG: phage tail sheath family protein [Candidatus Aminicenantes bacterium]|nr:phage tail sheath family protein [Candidatus Aminicenantes bacterium]
MANVTYPGVYMEEISSGVRPLAAASTSTAAFVGLTEKGPTDGVERITNWTEYQKHYGIFIPGSYLAESVFQFFNNGGSQCYIVRVTRTDAAAAAVTVQNREATPADAITFSAKNEGAWGNSLHLQIEDGTDDSANTFKVSIRIAEPGTDSEEIKDTDPREVFDNLSMDTASRDYVMTVINNRSSLLSAVVLYDPKTQPDLTNPDLRPAKTTDVIPLANGTDGEAALNETSYSSEFTRLDTITDFSLLAVPGIGTTIMMDAGMTYCSNRNLQDVFYIGEMSQDEDIPAEAEAFRGSIASPNSYGAVYYPWIKALDPSGKSKEPVLLPPSGYIAGLFARIDSDRGVWKAPAGTEATLSGAVGLASILTDVQQGNLNRINVNCIRRFVASGIVTWGARTVTSDPEWTYVPVRRMAIMLRVSIYNGLQWVVFEPNDEDLWGQIRLNLNSFMMTLFRKGAFQGSSASQAFFVKCDAETTTQDDINLGIVNVLVGFAPLKPAEFVVVKISQKAGQAS